MRFDRDLRATAVAAAVLTALALVIPVGWLSLLLLAPVAFALTGYTIFAAVFVRPRASWSRTAVICLGLSLAVLAILPLPLNYLGGLRPGTWALALVLVVLLGCGIAAARRGPEWKARPLPRFPQPPLSAALIALAALLLTSAALVLAFVPLSNSKAVGFTELSLRPLATTTGAAVRIGVASQEQETTAYQLKVQFGNEPPLARPLVLAPGESKVVELQATPEPPPGQPLAVRAELFRRGQPDIPYRHVYGWVRAATASP